MSIVKELDKIMKDLPISGNPYMEKWGRGRPSKEAIEKRKKAQQWVKDHPAQYPFLTTLLNRESNHHVRVKNGKVKVMYYTNPRCE